MQQLLHSVYRRQTQSLTRLGTPWGGLVGRDEEEWAGSGPFWALERRSERRVRPQLQSEGKGLSELKRACKHEKENMITAALGRVPPGHCVQHSLKTGFNYDFYPIGQVWILF